MLTFTEEEFEKYQNRIAGERREAQLGRSYQGAVSRAQGAQFEQAIAGAASPSGESRCFWNKKGEVK